jgi:hypothetical protein
MLILSSNYKLRLEEDDYLITTMHLNQSNELFLFHGIADAI